ncbi:MAG: hypothetical protein ACFB22_13865 [Rhodothalassiaceae bacterium]
MTDQTLKQQIEGLTIDSRRPLIISDADEVLLQFALTFETFLAEQGCTVQFDSFKLLGNVRDSASGQPVAPDRLGLLLNRFFSQHVGDCPPVAGAVDALARLSDHAQVIILSNVPASAAALRRRSMARHGLDYPLISNTGPKGPAVQAIRKAHRARAVFLDDIPMNLTSVAAHDAAVHRIQFIADERLRPLLPACPDAHARIDVWPEAEAHILAYLTGP